MKKQLITIELPSRMGKPALRALAAAGISKFEELSAISEKELLKLHGIGPKAIRIIKEELQKHGMDFAKPENTILISDIANQKIERRK
jgi:predicted flap endonuclease-1-like 5' DNA nuclease